ncbi:MAG: exopolysaccharide biosynthesis protein [Alphaproteobacteria bacterium]|nr:exopolysaccharide biosynthesis protein [Alphaproteobacteria bacterium]
MNEYNQDGHTGTGLTRNGADAGLQSASALLARLQVRLLEGPLTLGEAARLAGPHAQGLLLLLLALPEALPLPVAGLSTVLALPLILLSLHMVLRGSDLRLPHSLQVRRIPARGIRSALKRLSGFLERLSRLSRPRWPGILRRTRAVGFGCLTLSLVIALPIPFGNFIPALCIVGIALGLLQRDGAIVTASLAIGLTFSAFLIVAGSLMVYALA